MLPVTIQQRAVKRKLKYFYRVAQITGVTVSVMFCLSWYQSSGVKVWNSRGKVKKINIGTEVYYIINGISHTPI